MCMEFLLVEYWAWEWGAIISWEWSNALKQVFLIMKKFINKFSLRVNDCNELFWDLWVKLKFVYDHFDGCIC